MQKDNAILQRAMSDPGAVYAAPAEVLEDAQLTTAQKIEILRRWAYDASETGVALEEGMRGDENGLLESILRGLEALGAEIDIAHTGASKQHGIPG